jgi:large subunit ribosomal protein L22
LNVLRFTNRGSAEPIEKVLRSAINNWEQKYGMDPTENELYVKECFIDGGKTMRRFMPAPHGRAYRIRKRTNHITVVVASKKAANASNTELESKEN